MAWLPLSYWITCSLEIKCRRFNCRNHTKYITGFETELSKFRALMSSLGLRSYLGRNISYLLVSDWFINNRIEWCIGVRKDGSNLLVKYHFYRSFSRLFPHLPRLKYKPIRSSSIVVKTIKLNGLSLKRAWTAKPRRCYFSIPYTKSISIRQIGIGAHFCRYRCWSTVWVTTKSNKLRWLI